SSDLRTGAASQLTQLGQILAKYPDDRIRVQGFTDDRGSMAYNKLLSERRADIVRNALIDQGVKPDQIIAPAFGESQPVAKNSTASGRQKNRRVLLIVDVPAQRHPASK